jgi:tripartite-type tricarboxylate transporter receptor subunit TctC
MRSDVPWRSRRRNGAAPDIPTLHEAGLADFESINWQGVLAPAGTPAAIVARRHGELARIAADPEFEARVKALGFAPAPEPPARFAEEIRQETARWARIVKAANLKLE